MPVPIACPGACPPPFVLRPERKDRAQIEARIRHCLAAARRESPALHGIVSVEASIGGRGNALRVSVDATDEIPPRVVECVRPLVTTAPFVVDRGMARTIRVDHVAEQEASR